MTFQAKLALPKVNISPDSALPKVRFSATAPYQRYNIQSESHTKGNLFYIEVNGIDMSQICYDSDIRGSILKVTT